MEGSQKVYFSTEPTIYCKSLGMYLKSCYYLDEVWLTHFSMIKEIKFHYKHSCHNAKFEECMYNNCTIALYNTVE